MRPTAAPARTAHTPTTAGQRGAGLSLSGASLRPSRVRHMATINEVLAALTELRSNLETHAWQPDEYEHDMATAMRAEGGASAHSVRVGLRAAGPEPRASRPGRSAARRDPGLPDPRGCVRE